MAPYYVPYYAAHERVYPDTAAVNLYDNRADAEAHVRELNRKWREEWNWGVWIFWWFILGCHQPWYVREEFILVDPDDDDDVEPLD